MPLANDLRPRTLEESIGQEHITKGSIEKMLKIKRINNIIFYGPPGIGKTTLAEIISTEMELPFYKVNASLSNISELKEIIEKSQKNGETKFILFVDEIHLFRKNIQQFLLDYIEHGTIILIGSTSENPFFTIHKAILSRCNVFEFKPLSNEEIVKGLKRAFDFLISKFNEFELINDNKILYSIAEAVNGDMRSALNKLELIFYSCIDYDESKINFVIENVSENTFKRVMMYDSDGDSHFNTLSAFMKSIRGSDADASIHYLARLIIGGDLQGICRRLLCSTSEDVGLANPQAVCIVKACVDNALQLGFPEARLPLAQATLYLANSPKSNSAYIAINQAIADVETIDTGDIPNILKDSHYSGALSLGHGNEYKYPHCFKNNFVKQTYLPEQIKEKKYYAPQNNKQEQSFKSYWDKIKGEV